MKLTVHLTKDNITKDAAYVLYHEILEKFKDDPNIHVNGQVLEKYEGSHHTGQPGPPGEI